MPADLPSLARRLTAASGRLDRSLSAAHRAIASSVRRHLTSTAARAPSEYRSTTEVLATDDGVAVRTTHPAAEALERGGRIQGSPFVAVPVSEAARATGGPRNDGQLVAIRTRDGRLWLMSRRSAEIRWRLVESVQAATARPIGRAVDLAEAEAIESLGDALADALGVP